MGVCVCLRLCERERERERERDCLVLTCLRVEKERKKVPHVLWSTPSFEGQMGAVCVGVLKSVRDALYIVYKEKKYKARDTVTN